MSGSEPVAAARSARPALNIVLVEDNSADAEILARYLAKAGITASLRRVETEPEFVAALNETRPDLIISDFSLPNFDGIRALAIAVVTAPDTPFIYVSGTIGEERAISALRRGATDYVLKSNLPRLSSVIGRALREAAARSAKAASERLRQEQEVRLQRLSRSYRMLSSTASAILRLRNRSELLGEVCRIAVFQGGYDRVSVSLIDPGSGTLRPRASAANQPERAGEARYLDLELTQGADAAERAVHLKAPVVLDALADERHFSHADAASAKACSVVAAVPLLIDGVALGAMSLFTGERGIFDDAELSVLLELSANLAYALRYMDKNDAVQFLSYFDTLTGLARRPLYCQRLAEQLASAASGAPPITLAVAVFDVQQLGAINDTVGRHVGDCLLEAIAARLKERYPDPGVLAHLGGGTFAITLSAGAEAAQTALSWQAAAAQLLHQPFRVEGQELRPSIRSGVALHPGDADSADALVQAAEAALAGAREQNERTLSYGEVSKRRTPRGMALEARLAGALDRGEFLLHYQPKVDIASGAIAGFEALLRWQDSEDGGVSPAVFVPLLEQSGAIVEVGGWVLEQAVRDMRAWAAAGLPAAHVAVNVSPLQLRRHDFARRILETGAPAMADGLGVEIEITESMLMQDLELSIRKLTQLREAGVSVAIDDFGTGYSSLRLLARLPVDTLKIDRSFVQGITETRNLVTLVSTIVTLARTFSMRTVAEGVETPGQLQALRSLQCDQAQGYLYSRPVPSSAVPAMIERLHAAR